MPMKLYAYPDDYKTQKILIAAKYVGLDVETPTGGATAATGRMPVLETDQGCIFSSTAIARHISRISRPVGLYGQSTLEGGKIDSWVEFCTHELEVPLCTWVYPIKGVFDDVPEATACAKEDVKRALGVLDSHLLHNTYFVGNSVTLADISICCALVDGMRLVLDEGLRKDFGNVMRWFNLCLAQQEFSSVLGEVNLCTGGATGGGAPAPEEAKPKQAAKQNSAKPKAEPKAEANAEPKAKPELSICALAGGEPDELLEEPCSPKIGRKSRKKTSSPWDACQPAEGVGDHVKAAGDGPLSDSFEAEFDPTSPHLRGIEGDRKASKERRAEVRRAVEKRARAYEPKLGEELFIPESHKGGVLLLRPDKTFAYIHDSEARFSEGVQGEWSEQAEDRVTLMPADFGWCYQESFDPDEIIGVCHTVTLRRDQDAEQNGRMLPVCLLPEESRAKFSWMDPTLPES